MGIFCPLGQNIDEFWENLSQGQSGIRNITRFDPAPSRTTVAGTIQNYDPRHYFSPREQRSCEAFVQYGLLAAREALAQSRIINLDHANCAVVAGTGIGGIVSYKKAYDALYLPDSNSKINALTIPRMMNNALSAQIAIDHGLRGRNLTINTACSSGANAIGVGTEWLQTGLYDTVICGGAEAPVTYELLRTWEAMGVLSRSKDSPRQVCKPFAVDRDGFVLSEGAAMFVLETEESCFRRNQTPLAEVIGFASNCDATSLTSPDLKGVSNAIQNVLEDAKMSPGDVDCINLHGTGTKLNDQIEGTAIREIFGDQIPLCTVNKSQLGHSMGAASAIEAAASVLTLQHQTVPPSLNCQPADPACHLHTISPVSRKHKIKNVLSNSFAFGGSNACLMFCSCN
jgi:3-oxoacyl-[acyl-carrier-protein] synthase II